MARPYLTPEQKLYRCRTDLYMERNRVKLLKTVIAEKEDSEKETRDFIN